VIGNILKSQEPLFLGGIYTYFPEVLRFSEQLNEIDTWDKLKNFLAQHGVTDGPEKKINTFLDKIKRANIGFYQKSKFSLSRLNEDIIGELKNRIFLKEGVEVYLQKIGLGTVAFDEKDRVISAFSHLLGSGILPWIDSLSVDEILALLKGEDIVSFSKLIGIKRAEDLSDLSKIKTLSVSDLYYQIQAFLTKNRLTQLDLDSWNVVAENYTRDLLKENLARMGVMDLTKVLTFDDFPPGILNFDFDRTVTNEGRYRLAIWNVPGLKGIDLSELSDISFIVRIKPLKVGDREINPKEVISSLKLMFSGIDNTSEAILDLQSVSETGPDEEGYYNYPFLIKTQDLEGNWDSVKENVLGIGLNLRIDGIPFPAGISTTGIRFNLKDFKFRLPVSPFLDAVEMKEFLDQYASLKNWDFAKARKVDQKLLKFLLAMKDIYGSDFPDTLTQIAGSFKSIFSRDYFLEYWNFKDIGVLASLVDGYKGEGLQRFTESQIAELNKREDLLRFIEDNILYAKMDLRDPVKKAIYDFMIRESNTKTIADSLRDRILKVAQLSKEVLSGLRKDYPTKNVIIDYVIGDFNLDADDFKRGLRASTLDNYLMYFSYIEKTTLGQSKEKINNFWREFLNQNVSGVPQDILSTLTGFLGTKLGALKEIPTRFQKDFTADLLHSLLVYLNLKDPGQIELVSILRQDSIFNELSQFKTNQKLEGKDSSIPERGKIIVDIGNLVTVDINGLIRKMEELSREFSEEGAYIRREAAYLLTEGYLERNLDFENNLDFLMTKFIEKLNEKKGLEYLRSTLDDMQGHKLGIGEKIDFLKKYAQGINQRPKPTDWDWYWMELVGGSPVDKMVDLILSSGDLQNILEKTLHDFGPILRHDPRDNPFQNLFAEAPNRKEMINFILGKSKYIPYNSYLFRQPINGFNAVTSAGKLSYDYEVEGNPFTSDEVKQLLILSPAIQELLQVLSSPRGFESRDIVKGGEEWFDDELNRLIEYFMFTLDRRNNIGTDALNSTANTFISIAFILPAWIKQVENGTIPIERADGYVLKLLDFLEDNPLDPNDFAFPKFNDRYPHYICNEEERCGNSEYSTIDSIIPYGSLSDYTAFTKNPLVREKINSYLAKKGFGDLLVNRSSAITSLGKLRLSSALGYAWTPERGHSQGGVNFYNEYILAYLFALGVPNSKILPDDFYRAVERLTKSNLLGSDSFVVPWENAMFQVQYPLFKPLLFLKDSGFNQGPHSHAQISSQGLNHYRNAIKVIENYQDAALFYSPLFKYNYHFWSMGASAAVPEYYSMILGVNPSGRGYENHDGTISPSGIMGSLTLSPYRAYQAIRYMEEAFPEARDRFGFKSSVSEFRTFAGNKAAPATFALDKGLELFAIDNIKNFGVRGKQSMWELSIENETFLRGIFRLGFQEDLSPRFYQAYSLLGKGEVSPEDAITAVITKVDKEELSKWLQSNAPGLVERLNRRWENELSRTDFGGQIEQVNRGLEAISKDIANGIAFSEIKDKFFNILDKSKTIGDYNYLSNWVKQRLQIKELTYLMRGGEIYGMPHNEFETKVNIVDPDHMANYKLFPLLYHTIIAQTKNSLNLEEREKRFKAQVSSLGNNRLLIGEAYLIELREISEMAQFSDERSIFAFQYYLKKEKEYITKAIENLKGALSETGLDFKNSVKAETLLFVAYRMGWRYELQKQQFKKLSDSVKALRDKPKEDSLNIISTALMPYYEEELTAILETLRGLGDTLSIKDLRFADYWRKKEEPAKASERKEAIANYLRDILDQPEDIKLNQFSLIPQKESSQASTYRLNILNPIDAGRIGGYISKLVYQGKPPEQIISELTVMIEVKPIVAAALNKKVIDIFNNEKDLSLLSYAASLKQEGYDNAAIARAIGGVAERVAGVSAGEIPQSIRGRIQEMRGLFKILNDNGSASRVISAFSKDLNLREQGILSWTKAISDLFATRRIQEMVNQTMIAELNKIEPLSSALITSLNNLAFDDTKGQFFKYKDGIQPNLDLLDVSVLERLRPLYAIYGAAQEAGIISRGGSLNENDVLLLKIWTVLGKEKKLDSANTRGAFQTIRSAIANRSGLADIKPAEVITFISSTFLPTLEANYLKDRDGLLFVVNEYLEDLKSVGTNLSLPFNTVEDLMVADSYLKLARQGLVTADALSSHRHQILSNGILEGLRNELKISQDIWSGVVIPSMEVALGKTLTEVGQGERTQLKDILNLSPWEPKETSLISYVNFKDKIDIIENLNNTFREIKEEFPSFLKKYVLGRNYNPTVDLSLYQKWAGELLPRIVESLHRTIELKRQGSLIAVMGEGLTADKVKPYLPETQDVLEREAVSPVVNWLYGKDLLQEVFRVTPGANLTQGNLGYRALLSFYADQPEPISLSSLMLAVQRVLIKDKEGLEYKYGRTFDLVKSSKDIGVAGYYMTKAKREAGLGLFEGVVARLLYMGKNRTEIETYLDNQFRQALFEVVVDRGMGLLEKTLAQDLNIDSGAIKKVVSSWREYVREIKTDMGFVGQTITSFEAIKVVNEIISRLRRPISEIGNLKTKFDGNKEEELSNYLKNILDPFKRNLLTNDDLAVAGHIARILISDYSALSALERYTLLYQIISLEKAEPIVLRQIKKI
jgi:hypothetical protein